MRLPHAPVFALLTGALIWGLVWFPYRALREAGLAAAWATVFTYGFAWLLLALRFGGAVWRVGPDRWLLAIAIGAGAANVGFLIAVMYGQVARVVLLFYLAPVWTVGFAWWLLGERPRAVTLATTALALAGAGLMLWNPGVGLPWPAVPAEWLALLAGIAFAGSNVLVPKTTHVETGVRSFYIFSGSVLLGLAAALLLGQPLALPAPAWPMLMLVPMIGVTMLLCNWIVQFGLTKTPANQAIVIYTSELVFAALSGWLLAGEALGWKEAAGGALVIIASLVSAWAATPKKASPQAPGS